MRAQRFRWLSLLLAASPVSQAQVQPQLQEATLSSHAVTARQGRAIVNAAWEREQSGRKPDCSHLVHEIYVLAGFPYAYASSFEVYVGIPGFVRVSRPQPGDLVVWRGHVGIVVDPAEHSFYSSVSSGLRTESWDAPHWKARGTPRFFRYAVPTPAKASLKESRSASAAPEPAPTRVALAGDDAGENLPDAPRLAMKGPEPSSVPTSKPEPGLPHPGFEIPTSILVVTEQRQPSQAEVASAISELSSASGEILRVEDLSRFRRKVIVYDSLTLDRPKFNSKRGSAQVQIVSRATLAADGASPSHSHVSLKWDLVRSSNGWEVLAPKSDVYVPRDVAIRVLAARLASLTQEGNASDENSLRTQTQIVRVLGILFD